MKNTFRNALVTIGSFIFVISIVSAWTGPSDNPPGGNVKAPINESINPQVKAGGLGVGSLQSLGAIQIGNTSTACSVALSGSVRWTGTGMEYCNGTAWLAFGGSGNTITTEYKSCNVDNVVGPDQYDCTASCSTGYKVIGGGYGFGAAYTHGINSYPVTGGTGWYCGMALDTTMGNRGCSTGSGSCGSTCFAICAIQSTSAQTPTPTPSTGKRVLSGTATVGFTNGQPHSTAANVTFPSSCTNPTVVAMPGTNASNIACSDGASRVGICTGSSSASQDLNADVFNVSSSGFVTRLSGESGVCVGVSGGTLGVPCGGTSPAYEISWIATCDN